MSSERRESRGPGVGSDEFRRACGRFVTGVTIATTVDAQGLPHGLTVSSFAAVSLDPPLVLICLGHEAASLDAFRTASHFGINVLTAGQREVSEHFARKGHDRFEGLSWRRGESGVPLLACVLATMECAVEQRILAGDHDVFIGRMIHAQVRDGEPLVHYASRYRRLGPHS